MDKKQWYLSMVDFHQKTIEDWRESADRAREMGNAPAVSRREAYAKEAERDLTKLLDAAHREGVVIEVPEPVVTRNKLVEELTELNRRVAHYQQMLEERDADRASLREELAGFQLVRQSMENEREETWRLLERYKVFLGGPLMVASYLGLIWAGMEILKWAGMATSSPMAFIGVLLGSGIGAIAGMIGLERMIER